MAMSDLSGVIFKTRDSTTNPPDAAPSSPWPRRALGLKPASAPDDDEATDHGDGGRSFAYRGPEAAAKEIVAASVAHLPAEALDAGVRWRDLLEYGIATALEASFEEGDVLRERIREQARALRAEISDLRAALTEARHETRELKLIQESLRVSTRAESGRDGSRGIPGRDGQQGPIGPRGEVGPRGEPARAIVDWQIDEDRFIATPQLSDGSTGAPLNSSGAFRRL